MNHSELSLWALSPLDGRYFEKVNNLRSFLSEGALNCYRIKVELLWTLHLLEAMKEKKFPQLVDNLDECLLSIRKLSQESYYKDINRVKKIEKTIRHDVKSCEYFIQDLIKQNKLEPKLNTLIHFACTSEDINNLAYGLMLKDMRKKVLLPSLASLRYKLSSLVDDYKNMPLLARTHGQAASPTTFGKELSVFAFRFFKQEKELKEMKVLGKINGAVGNYNAHTFTLPDVDWPQLCKSFVTNKLELEWNPYTTQIESHDYLAKLCQNISLTSTIAIGLCQDIWSYISSDILGQKYTKNEVGSSTMPHKVNPIDFENAEGNYGLCRSLANHLAEKLPISRRQRDLSDSTAQRSLGNLFGHFILAQDSLLKGLSKIEAKETTMNQELERHWEVLAEPVQMLLRRYGVTDAYERLKEYTRGQTLTQEKIREFVASLTEIPEEEKNRLYELTPASYIGIAPKLAEEIIKTIN